MAQTYAVSGLTPQQWDSEFFTDYVRSSRFKRYMGTDEGSIIQLKEDLAKKKGDSVTFALVNELVGDGVTGNQTLKGNEERLGSRSHKVTLMFCVTLLRLMIGMFRSPSSTSAMRPRLNCVNGRRRSCATASPMPSARSTV